MTKQEHKQWILENLIYLIIWVGVLIVPVIWEESSTTKTTFEWAEVLRNWEMVLPFFLLFVINNFILIPCFLIHRKRSWIYLLCTLVIVTITITINTRNLFTLFGDNMPPEMKKNIQMRKVDMHPDGRPEKNIRPPMFDNNHQPKFDDQGPMINRPPMDHLMFMSPSFQKLLVVLLIIGLNIAIKLLFKSIRDERQMKELEKRTLQTELENLKHQLNPHFFMNTLNNIHALIDIDSEKAKETIIELSKLMRYILYDSSLPAVPLEKEIQFLNNYIALMRIRYMQQVEILIHLPEEIPNIKVPPLLFISFLENAFKHGISYQRASYVHLSIEIIDKELHCLLVNSNFNKPIGHQHIGIGLENSRKRLQLLYGNNYTLHIEDISDEYHVLLIIPLENEMYNH